MKYCELLGCRELTATFCLSDDRVYGDMCGIAFERHGTIGRGSDKCDFYFYPPVFCMQYSEIMRILQAKLR